jgi:hypothetical protein
MLHDGSTIAGAAACSNLRQQLGSTYQQVLAPCKSALLCCVCHSQLLRCSSADLHHQQFLTFLQIFLQTFLQLESSRAIVSCQGLQHVYLFLASMFGQAPANHAAMLQRLNVSQQQQQHMLQL